MNKEHHQILERVIKELQDEAARLFDGANVNGKWPEKNSASGRLVAICGTREHHKLLMKLVKDVKRMRGELDG